MLKNKIMKGIISLLICVAVLFANDANVNAATKKVMVIETIKNDPFSGILSYYNTSVKLPSGFLGISQSWAVKAKFDSAKRVMVMKITTPVRWKGGSTGASSLKITYSNSVEISGTTSVSLSKEIGVSVPVYAAEVSAKIGGSVANSTTISASEMKSYEYVIDKGNASGYYGIVVAYNTDLYDVTLSRNSKTKKGKLLKFESGEPYIDLHYSTGSF